jgi:hypothetical protein
MGIAAAVQFAMELCLLVAVAWWGTAGFGLLLGLALPLVVAVLWGTFCAPKAAVRLPAPVTLALRTLLFAVGFVALLAVGHPVLATVYAVLVVASTVALQVGERREDAARAG